MLTVLQLWPENPTYQVYVPGYQHHVSMTHHPAVYGSQTSIHGGRARSVSPNTTPNGLPLENPNGTTDRRGILYAELQFPVTSNYGSMKKRSKRSAAADSTNTTASTSVHSGEPSPSNHMMMSLNDDPVAAANNNASQQSLDSVHRYVPDYVAISNRKTAV